MHEPMFPDYGDLLDATATRPADDDADREGLVLNRSGTKCRQCGLVHPHMTGSITSNDGQVYCGIPILWSNGWVAPPGEQVVAPEHGLQVLIFGRDELRLAIVWRADRGRE